MNGMVTDFLVVADQIFILVLLIAVVYAGRIEEVMDTRATRASASLQRTIPALIIAAMQVPITPARIADTEMLLLATGAFFALSFIVARAASKAMSIAPSEKGVYEFAIVFGSVSFMGFPVAQVLLGDESLFYVALFNIVFNILLFSAGIAMLTGEREGGFDPKLLINPGIAASVAGFALFLGSVGIHPLHRCDRSPRRYDDTACDDHRRSDARDAPGAGDGRRLADLGGERRHTHRDPGDLLLPLLSDLF